MYNPYDMLDFLLSFKINDAYLKALHPKIYNRKPFTAEEISYIESIFQCEISRLRRITNTRFKQTFF
jgi:hypothetical protein